MTVLFKQVVSTIDSRTSVVCLHAAGDIVPVDEPFETLAGDYMEPPFHMYCRSIVQPWVKGMVSIQRGLANEELQQRPLKERRLGPDGEIGGSMPPPSPVNPPSGWSLSLATDPDLYRPMALVDDVADKFAAAAKELDAANVVARTVREAEEGDEFDALERYQEDSTNFNGTLRWRRNRLDEDDELRRTIETVDALLRRQGGLPEDIVTYRGVIVDYLSELAIGDTIEDPGFISTALLEESTKAFRYGSDPVLMEVFIPRGQQAGLVGRILDPDDSLLGWESEVLLPRNTKMQLVGKTTRMIDGKNTIIYRMEVVP